jgi:predicted DNA-binding transcriptional regulator AlpA
MSEQQALAKKLVSLQRELDECAEWLGRIAKAVPEPEQLALVGASEAATLLGVKANTIQQWRKRGILPEPVAKLACGPIWREQDIKQWAARRAAA